MYFKSNYTLLSAIQHYRYDAMGSKGHDSPINHYKKTCNVEPNDDLTTSDSTHG